MFQQKMAKKKKTLKVQICAEQDEKCAWCELTEKCNYTLWRRRPQEQRLVGLVASSKLPGSASCFEDSLTSGQTSGC